MFLLASKTVHLIIFEIRIKVMLYHCKQPDTEFWTLNLTQGHPWFPAADRRKGAGVIHSKSTVYRHGYRQAVQKPDA